MPCFLMDFMLKEQREYIISKVKDPLLKAIIILANRLGIEPNKENCVMRNSHTLIDIWDKFLEMENNSGRDSLFRALRKISIAENEHDIYYRDRLNVFIELLLEAILKGQWKPRSLDHPNECWKVDPNQRGVGYEFIKDRYYHKEKYANIGN